MWTSSSLTSPLTPTSTSTSATHPACGGCCRRVRKGRARSVALIDVRPPVRPFNKHGGFKAVYGSYFHTHASDLEWDTYRSARPCVCDGTAEHETMTQAMLTAALAQPINVTHYLLHSAGQSDAVRSIRKYLASYPDASPPVGHESWARPSSVADIGQAYVAANPRNSKELSERFALLAFASPQWHRALAHWSELLTAITAAADSYREIDQNGSRQYEYDASNVRGLFAHIEHNLTGTAATADAVDRGGATFHFTMRF